MFIEFLEHGAWIRKWHAEMVSLEYLSLRVLMEGSAGECLIYPDLYFGLEEDVTFTLNGMPVIPVQYIRSLIKSVEHFYL